MEKLYTITALSENEVGLLNQISIIFTRRKLNIESLSVSASAISGVHKFVITTNCDEAMAMVQQSASSSDSVLTVPSALTRTPSRSSVTTHLSTARHTSTMTRRSQADTHAHTSVSETSLSRLLTS